MLIKKTGMKTEIREKMRDGNGNVEMTHFAGREDLPEKCRLFSNITLEKGCSIGEHKHEGECELFSFISGSGFVTDDGEVKEVAAGDVMITHDGHTHSVECTSDEPLRFVAVIILN